MAIKRATIYPLSTNDDINTMVKKINSMFRNISQDITVTNTTITGEAGVKYHRELPDTSDPDCHPITAITGLELRFVEILEKLEQVEQDIENIQESITDIQEILDDHEERITALEDAALKEKEI